jgi:predicted HNH restriction endonuclease
MSFAVITENDTSAWMDETGVRYHFPKRYLPILQPGTEIVYYKGRMRDKKFSQERLSPEPHYFGVGKIKAVEIDLVSDKEDYFPSMHRTSSSIAPCLFKWMANILRRFHRQERKIIFGMGFEC